MKDFIYMNKQNINEDNSSGKGNESELYKNKKRKIKAYEIPVKEFFSDNEDDDDGFFKRKFDKYDNQRKINLKNVYKKSQNSILLYKQQLQKKSTIDQTPKKKTERELIIIEDINSIKEGKNKKSKNVNFPKDNFINVIEVESYKNTIARIQI